MEPTSADLAALRALSTPTVSNAIEAFDVRPRNSGFMHSGIRCMFPELGVMVGYAATLRFAASAPPARPASRYLSWKHSQTLPAPRIVVAQDMDPTPGVGAFFGEVMATIHGRLGCVGAITNGCVRDLDEARGLGFHFFASGACVSHAYVHQIDYGGPVEIGGVVVRDGDLIHGDKHGVLLVPKELVREIPAMAARQIEREKVLLDICRSPDFTVEALSREFES